MSVGVAADRLAWCRRALWIGLDFLNVTGRYSGAFSIIGVDEVEIRMDVIVGACPYFIRKAVVLLEMAVMLAVVTFVGWQSFAYVQKVFMLGTVSDIAGIPMWIPHSAVCVSFVLIAIVVLVRGSRLLAGTAAAGRDNRP